MTRNYYGYNGFTSFGYPFLGGLLGGFLGNVISPDDNYRYPPYYGRPFPPPYPYYNYPRHPYPRRRGPYRRYY